MEDNGESSEYQKHSMENVQSDVETKSQSSDIVETQSTSDPKVLPTNKSSPSQSRNSGLSSSGVKSLTPWHQWLLKKEVQRREQTKNFKLLHKASTSPCKKTVQVHTSKISHQDQHRIVNEWVRKKDQDWRKKRWAETKALQERLSKEQEVKELTAKMAKLKFKAWKDQKDVEDKQKRSHKVESVAPDLEEKKRLNDDSYTAWLQTVKDREKRQLAFRQLIVRGAYKAKPAANRNRKQGKPQKSDGGNGIATHSILCVLYCPRNSKR